VVQGRIVTDGDVLADLTLPDDEIAVEIPTSLLPEVLTLDH
jgi:hypothetical protein